MYLLFLFFLCKEPLSLVNSEGKLQLADAEGTETEEQFRLLPPQDLGPDFVLIRSVNFPELFVCHDTVKAVSLVPMASDTSLCTWKLSQEGDGSLVFNALRSQAVTELALSFDGKAALLSSNQKLSTFQPDFGTRLHPRQRQRTTAGRTTAGRTTAGRTTAASSTGSPPTNFIRITQASNPIQIAELVAINRNTNKIAFTAVTASSTQNDVSRLTDDNPDTFFSTSTHAANIRKPQTLTFALKNDEYGVAVIRITSPKGQPLNIMLGLTIEVGLGSWRWSTQINRVAPHYTIHVPLTTNRYSDNIIVRDDKDVRYKTEGGKLRPYANPKSWVDDGAPRYTEILDSAMLAAEKGNPITSPASPVPRVVMLKRPQFDVLSDRNVINIAEVEFFDSLDQKLRVLTPIATSDSGSNPGTFLIDGDVKTYIQTRLGDPFELSNDQFLIFPLDTLVKQISRIQLVSRMDCCSERVIGLEVLVSVGSFFFSTTIISDPDVVTIPIPWDGKYPNGLASRDYNSGIIYYHENGVRRMVSKDVHAASGYFPFYSIADSAFNSLPLGENLEPLESTRDFIVLYKTVYSYRFDVANVLQLADIVVTTSNGEKVDLKRSDIFLSSIHEPNSQALVLDGSASTFVQTRHRSRDPQLLKDQMIYVRLPKISGTISTITLRNTATDQDRMNGVRVVVKCNNQYFETSLTSASASYTLSLTRHSPVATGDLFYARNYGVSFRGTLIGQTVLATLDIPLEQCPQKCDYTKGCAGFSYESTSSYGCKLLQFPTSAEVSSSTTTVTVLATGVNTGVSSLKPVRERRIYLYRTFIDPKTAQSRPWIGAWTDCAAACDNSANCIAYVIQESKKGECLHVEKFTPSKAPVPKTHGFIALLPIQSLLSSPVDAIGKYFGTRLEVSERVLFIGTESPMSVANIRFEASGSAKQFLCRSGDRVSLMASPGRSLSCDWQIEPVKDVIDTFRIRSAESDKFYLSNEVYNQPPRVTSTPADMLVVIMERGTVARPYTKPVYFEYAGSRELSSFSGSLSLCFSECDKKPDCVGYTASISGSVRCSLKSSLGPRTNRASADATYEFDQYTKQLATKLPWQIAMALKGSSSRTTATGLGVHIHLIDSGVTQGLGDPGFFNDWNFIHASNDFSDSIGHADVIAKIFRYDTGIVPGATIHNLKVIDSNGKATPRSFVQAVADVIQKATNNFVEPYATRPTIISLSVVFPKDQDVNCMVQMAYTKNIYVVAAAGNDDANADNFSPADSGYALVVGAYEKDQQLRFTNHGFRVDLYAGSSDFMSKGKELRGTSLAAPQATAVLAKLLHERPEFQNLPPIYAFNILRAASDPNIIKTPRPDVPRALTDRTRFASAFTNKKGIPRDDHCRGRSIQQIVAGASTSPSGKAVASALSPSAHPNTMSSIVDTLTDDLNYL